MKGIKKSYGIWIFMFALLLGKNVNAQAAPEANATYVQDEETGTWKFAGNPDDWKKDGMDTMDNSENTGIDAYSYEVGDKQKAKSNSRKAADMIPISTEEELRNIAGNLKGNYILTADIVLEGSEWTAIGGRTEMFSGILDGNGHTISNLVSSTGNALFSDIGADAVVKNLTVSGTVTTTDAQAALLAWDSEGTILNCRTRGSVKQESGTYAHSLAGMVNDNFGYMENCVNEAKVAEEFGDLGDLYNYCFVGGVVSGNYGTIIGCENVAEITSDCMYTGGIAGSSSGGGLVENCVNKGTVTAYHDTNYAEVAVGGIVGGNHSTFVYNCVNEGAVNGPMLNYSSDVGGIVGDSGGFSEIIGCENKGSITGMVVIGGICGDCSIRTGTFDENDNFIVNEGEQIVADCINNGKVSGIGRANNMSMEVAGIIGSVGARKGEIDVLRCTNNGSISGNGEYARCGGVVGLIDTSETGVAKLEWLTNTGDVTAVSNDESATTWAGGVFHQLQATGTHAIIVSNCMNKGEVRAKVSYGIGNVSVYGDLEQCYNLGTIKGDNCSGITYDVNSKSTVKDCYNLGSIIANDGAFGIAGGVDDTSKLATSFNVGNITGGQEECGITGKGEVIDCYYLEQEYKEGSTQIGQVLLRNEIQLQSSYQGFDFNGIWKMQEQNNRVLPALSAIVELEAVELKDVAMKVSDTVVVKAATGSCRNFVSANASICTVDRTGEVKSKKAGNVKAYGISEDGQVVDFQITIAKSPQKLAVAISSAEIKVGKTASIKVKGIGEITYNSSDTSVATVNSKGRITGQKVGKAAITVNVAGNNLYGPATKTITLKVTAPAKGTSFIDASSKASYRVTKAGSTVEYRKPTNSKATKIAIPATVKMHGITYKVTSIADKAFKNNKRIKKVVVGKNVTRIGANTFNGCTKLASITLPEKLVTIGDKAFYKCTALTKIVIPSKVTRIGKQAFYGDEKLRSVTIQTTKLTSKNVGKKAFSGIYSKATIKVPKSKISVYKKILKSNGTGFKVISKK